jgi:hypothetical protein
MTRSTDRFGHHSVVRALVACGVLVGASSTSLAEVIWRSGSVLTINEIIEVSDSLIIEPGVTAYFGPMAGIDVLAGGTLTIQGSAESPIRLLPLDRELSWQGVWFLAGSQGAVRHAEVIGANWSALSIVESSPLIEFCRIGDIGEDQVVVAGVRAGIYVVGAGAAPVIRRCVIESIRGGTASSGGSGANGVNGANGPNGTIFGGDDGGPGVAGTNGSNAVFSPSLVVSSIGIWIAEGAGATIDSNVIRWIEGANGATGGHGGKGGNGGDGGDGYNTGISPGSGGGGGEGGQGGNGASGKPGGGAHGIFVDKPGGEVHIAGNAIYAIAGGRGGNGGNGGAGGDGGDGGEGGSCTFCSAPGDGGIGAAGGAGGAGGAAGPSGVTRAISIQLPLAPSTVHVVNNSVALIRPPEPALGGLGGAGGVGGLGGAGGEAQFGGAVGLDGADGQSGASGATPGPGSVSLAFGVSAAGAGLTVETSNHVSDLDPGALNASASAAFRAEVGAQMSVSHSVFIGHSTVAVGAVSFGPSSLEQDPAFVAPPLVIPLASDCCTWLVGQSGCADIACEAAVCGADASCCNSTWDSECAEYALTLCPTLCQPFAMTDLSLAAISPAIDFGTNDAVPAFLSSDLAFAPRVTDGDGNGVATVDAGAYESPALACGTDLTCDGAVDGADLAVLLGAWGPCASPCSADLDGSGAVDGADLAVLLGSWR